MNRGEAIKVLENATIEPTWGGSFRATSEALDMAIEALKRERTDEWCTDCKEYDTEKKCCPRFNRVIRGALKREPSEDLISRADAIEALGEEPLVWCDEEYEIAERNQWRADIEAIKSVPSADRPTDGDLISRSEAIEHFMRLSEDESLTPYMQMLMVGASNEIKKLPSADRPRGEWIDCIDRQELIGSIQYLFDGLADSWVEASEKIIEIIREEPTVPQKEYTEQQIRDTFNSGYSCGMHNEWITDEPPVDGQEVIATVYWTDYGDTITAYGHYNARFDTWSLYSDVEGGLNKGFEVIAWMPLPEPLCGADMRSE